MIPIRLESTAMEHFYRGGEHLAAFRGAAAPGGGRSPEEWLGSTVSRHGEVDAGVTVLGGVRLDDLVAAQPALWLGEVARPPLSSEGVKEYASGGIDGRSGAPVLVKLLDAGERLPMHVHPDAAFARENFGLTCGKAEAWLILRAPPEGGEIHLGFKRDVNQSRLREWFVSQDVEEMLGALNRVTVHPGDTVYVPPGVPHTIGEGIFLLEVQEPSDLSILLEWDGFAGLEPSAALLGMGIDTALAAVDRSGVSAEELDKWVNCAADIRSGRRSLLPREASPFFRLELLGTGGGGTETGLDGFRVLVVLDGEGTLTWSTGSAPIEPAETEPIDPDQIRAGSIRTKRGDAWLVPARVGPIRIISDEGVQAVLAAGPDIPDLGNPETHSTQGGGI